MFPREFEGHQSWPKPAGASGASAPENIPLPPDLEAPIKFIKDNAPWPLRSEDTFYRLFAKQDAVQDLLNDLNEHLKEAVSHSPPLDPTNSRPTDVWCCFGAILMHQSKIHQALRVFDELY